MPSMRSVWTSWRGRSLLLERDRVALSLHTAVHRVTAEALRGRDDDRGAPRGLLAANAEVAVDLDGAGVGLVVDPFTAARAPGEEQDRSGDVRRLPAPERWLHTPDCRVTAAPPQPRGKFETGAQPLRANPRGRRGDSRPAHGPSPRSAGAGRTSGRCCRSAPARCRVRPY